MKIKLPGNFKNIDFNALNLVIKSRDGLADTIIKEIPRVVRDIDEASRRGYRETTYMVVGPFELHQHVMSFLKSKNFQVAIRESAHKTFCNIVTLEIKW